MDETEKALWDVYDILTRAGWGEAPVTRDRYLNVDDPRDPPTHEQRLAAGIEGQPPAAETPRGGRGAPVGVPPDSETDRCVRAMRDVLLGQPVPRSLEEAAVEIERRMREGQPS